MPLSCEKPFPFVVSKKPAINVESKFVFSWLSTFSGDFLVYYYYYAGLHPFKYLLWLELLASSLGYATFFYVDPSHSAVGVNNLKPKWKRCTGKSLLIEGVVGIVRDSQYNLIKLIDMIVF